MTNEEVLKIAEEYQTFMDAISAKHEKRKMEGKVNYRVLNSYIGLSKNQNL